MKNKILKKVLIEEARAVLVSLSFIVGSLVSLIISISISPYFYFLTIPLLAITAYGVPYSFREIKSSYDRELKDEKNFDDGLHKFFFKNKKNQVQLELNILRGKRHGIFIEYYKSGQIELECNYSNGKLNGEYMSYHENGELEFQTKYNNGIQSGETKSYYNNGSIYRSFKLSDGNYEGEIKEFHKNGNLKFVSENKNYTFYKNNNIACEIEYSNPPKGIWKNYRDDGTIEYELDFNIKYSDRVLKTVYTKGGDIYSKVQYGCEIKRKIECNFSSEYAVKRMEAETIYIPSRIKGPPGISGTTVNLKIIESIDDIIDLTPIK